MPAAATHDRIALYAAGAMIVPGYLTLHYGLGDTPEAAYNGTMLLVGAHLFGSWWLSPDLDLDGKIDDRWGPLRPLWLPYMRMVPHRHFVSHSGFSGIFRLLYLFLVVSGVLAILSLVGYLLGADVAYYRDFTDWLWSAFQTSARPVWLVVVGVVISDIVHVLADVLSTRRKRGLLHVWAVAGGKRRPRRKRYRSHR
jgi:uncharacterized metal-binding protein